MSDELDQSSPWQQLEDLIESGQGDRIASFLESLPAGETAHTIVRMEEDKRKRLLELLPTDEAADLVEALSHVQAADLLEDLPAQRAAEIVDEIASDEQADLLAQLHEEDAEAILEHMSPEEAQDVRRLAMYGPDTAGGIMITEYLAYPQHITTDDIVGDLRGNSEKYSRYDVQYVYVVDGNTGQLRGAVRLRDLLLSPSAAKLTSVMLKNTYSVGVTDTLDSLANFFDRYAFSAAPVVDKGGRMIGVVRRSHVEEALGERSEKMMLRIGGIIGGEELRTMPLGSRAARRLAFLVPNIGLNLVAVSVIAFYEPVLAQVSALMIFLPILSDMSGCSGSQAVAVSMRELALGLVKPFEALHVLVKEAAVGVVNGLVLGVALGLIAWLMRGDAYPYLGLVVASAMVLNSLVAVCMGGTIPLLLKAIGVDPALASGPLLTTTTDLCGFFFALTFAKIMLQATGSL